MWVLTTVANIRSVLSLSLYVTKCLIRLVKEVRNAWWLESLTSSYFFVIDSVQVALISLQNGRPVIFLSHLLLGTDTRWYTGDQELFPSMIAVEKWDVHRRGREFIFRLDHARIRFLKTERRCQDSKSGVLTYDNCTNVSSNMLRVRITPQPTP